MGYMASKLSLWLNVSKFLAELDTIVDMYKPMDNELQIMFMDKFIFK